MQKPVTTESSKKYVGNYAAKAVVVTGLITTLAIAALAVPASAQTIQSATQSGQTSSSATAGHSFTRGGKAPGVFGTVSAISGTTLTVTSKGFMGGGWMGKKPGSSGSASSGSTNTSGNTGVAPAQTTPVTYTVDASNATVMKSGATSSFSAIAVGDTVMVQGTISGTNVTATTINDGVVRPMMQTPGQGAQNSAKSGQQSAPAFQGNGQPVVGGTVSAVSGTNLTVTNKSNVTYTVDASNSQILKMGTTTAISSVDPGDNVVIQGTVNGTSVTASTVIDQGATPASTTSTNGKPSAPAAHGGFFSSIGSFFSHLFGF